MTAPREIWISALTGPGMYVYDGIRIAVSDTEGEAYVDLAEWINEAHDDTNDNDVLATQAEIEGWFCQHGFTLVLESRTLK